MAGYWQDIGPIRPCNDLNDAWGTITVSHTNAPARPRDRVAVAFRPGMGHPCMTNPAGLSRHNAWTKKSPRNGGLLGGGGGLVQFIQQRVGIHSIRIGIVVLQRGNDCRDFWHLPQCGFLLGSLGLEERANRLRGFVRVEHAQCAE